MPTTTPPTAGSNASLNEPTKLYEELKQKLRLQPSLVLQEPVLTATAYLETIQANRPLRLPTQRVEIKPKGALCNKLSVRLFDLGSYFFCGLLFQTFQVFSLSISSLLRRVPTPKENT